MKPKKLGVKHRNLALAILFAGLVAGGFYAAFPPTRTQTVVRPDSTPVESEGADAVLPPANESVTPPETSAPPTLAQSVLAKKAEPEEWADPSRTLAGTVVDVDGKAVSDVDLWLTEYEFRFATISSEKVTQRTTSDSDGHFRFGDLSSAIYYVNAQSDEFVDGPVLVQLLDHSIENYRLVLGSTEYYLGVVSLPDGGAARGVGVHLSSFEEGLRVSRQTSFTEHDGHVRIIVAQGTSYQLTVERPLAPRTLPFSVVSDTLEGLPSNVRLSWGATVEVRVSLPPTLPRAESVSLHLMNLDQPTALTLGDSADRSHRSGFSDIEVPTRRSREAPVIDARASFWTIEPGVYSYELQVPGFPTESGRVELFDGLRKILTFAPPAPRFLEVRLEDEEAQPIVGADVSICEATDVKVDSYRTDATGRVTLPVYPTLHTLEFSASGHAKRKIPLKESDTNQGQMLVVLPRTSKVMVQVLSDSGEPFNRVLVTATPIAGELRVHSMTNALGWAVLSVPPGRHTFSFESRPILGGLDFDDWDDGGDELGSVEKSVFAKEDLEFVFRIR